MRYDDEPTARELAVEAVRAAFAEAEAVAALLDRFDTDCGERADIPTLWAERLRDLAEEIRAVLGEPSTVLGVPGRYLDLLRSAAR